MEIGITIDGDLRKLAAGIEKEVSEALRGGIKAATDGMKNDLRRQVEGAGLGRRLANTWRGNVYPRSGVQTLNPAGWVYSRAKKIALAFNEGSIVRAKKGTFLAIPTAEVAGMRTRFKFRRGDDNDYGSWSAGGGKGHRITPRAFVAETGLALQLIEPGRAGGPYLLIARRPTSGRLSRRAAARRGFPATGPGAHTFVAFIMVKQVKMPKKLDVARVFAEHERDLIPEIERILYG